MIYLVQGVPAFLLHDLGLFGLAQNILKVRRRGDLHLLRRAASVRTMRRNAEDGLLQLAAGVHVGVRRSHVNQARRRLRGDYDRLGLDVLIGLEVVRIVDDDVLVKQLVGRAVLLRLTRPVAAALLEFDLLHGVVESTGISYCLLLDYFFALFLVFLELQGLGVDAALTSCSAPPLGPFVHFYGRAALAAHDWITSLLVGGDLVQSGLLPRWRVVALLVHVGCREVAPGRLVRRHGRRMQVDEYFLDLVLRGHWPVLLVLLFLGGLHVLDLDGLAALLSLFHVMLICFDRDAEILAVGVKGSRRALIGSGRLAHGPGLDGHRQCRGEAHTRVLQI